jgi:succinate dehydrogenase/fumarate reductase flavoprotein subunit
MLNSGAAMAESETPIWDVAVLGAGAAGVNAAYHARQQGARVLLLSKGLVGRGGATVSSGGRIAVCGETLREELGLDGDGEDTRARFARHIEEAGAGLGDSGLAQVLIDGVGAELRRLADAGVKFPITQGGTGRGPGSSVRVPGPELQRVLNQFAVNAGVRIWEDFQAVRLLERDGRVVGVVGIDRRRGTVEAVSAKAVVLATGGASSNWRLRDTPEDLFGEGQAMALKAGAALVDMEFIQFLPCCVVNPPLWRGHQFPWRVLGPPGGVHAWLLNRRGERFMARWAPDPMEFAPEAVIAKAMAHEIAEGRGSASGGVYLSWAHLPHGVLRDLPRWSAQVDANWNWQGHDIKPLVDTVLAHGAVEVAAAAHFCLGGVKIDVDGWSGTPGLFACGEAAGGLHGADRIQGAAVAQALAQGRMAGAGAARAAADADPAPLPPLQEISAEIQTPLRRSEGLAPFEVKRRLVGVVDTALGPMRSGETLAAALDAVRDIRRNSLPKLACRSADPILNRDWMEALECEAAALVMEAALLSAQARPRSVGSHQRLDDPADGEIDQWNSVVSLKDSELVHRRAERTARSLATEPC